MGLYGPMGPRRPICSLCVYTTNGYTFYAVHVLYICIYIE